MSLSPLCFSLMYTGSEDVNGERSFPQRQKAQPRQRLKFDWELLFWMFASFATLYFTNFASNLLFNEKIKRYVIFGIVFLYLISP